MSTLCPNHSRPFPLGRILIVLVLGILAWFIVMQLSPHAFMTHGQAALNARDCWNKGGTVIPEVMQDPLTGRYMQFCRDKDNHWYAGIFGSDGGNVTAFPRSFAKCLTDLVEYAKRTGYTVKMIMPWVAP
jgi:hypothetical protein